ncbi:hypothetical protein [Dinghuibacter silviterrae]|uniref:PH (Pleckstrin Homology) domain-containing protein n=1 Tax=Dinghuibacter silviterrae TaxID=1539049 RepID=A0A4R8DUW5_9BACT|nr:hypothetical protein [Dinghuibacter silviterrae]TDX01756.1 hypothetical protein EDB95_2798 [Dinghuibacter silviterrae]
MSLPAERTLLTDSPWLMVIPHLLCALAGLLFFMSSYVEEGFEPLVFIIMVWIALGLHWLTKKRLTRDDQYLYVARGWQKKVIPLERVVQMYSYTAMFSKNGQRRWRVRYLDEEGVRKEFSLSLAWNNKRLEAFAAEVQARVAGRP